MKKLIVLAIVIAGVMVGATAVYKHNPTGIGLVNFSSVQTLKPELASCVVSKTNPYESLPMICKSVLQSPAKQ